MNNKTKFIAGAALSILALGVCANAKDKVIMTVNGIDVPVSEFAYLYGKNSQQQQLQQQPLDEYVELFKLYRMKVEEAKKAGIDTTAAFRDEISRYRHELVENKLVDSVYLEKLATEAYNRLKEEVEATHIMYFKTPDAAENRANRAKIDSIRNLIVNGADFAELARSNSQDRASAVNGGRMGYISSMQYPYAFETAVYNTPDGEVSEVFESPVGYHIVKGGKHRAPRGKVRAAHILRLTQGVPPQVAAGAKSLLDSLYRVVKGNPDAFADVATRYSEDPGSGAQGGELPWFGSGEMVAEFDSVAFALPNGEISEPFKTSYGWHIIKKLDSKGGPEYSEVKKDIMRRIANPQDDRFRMIRQNQNMRLAKLNKGKLNGKVVDAMKRYIAGNGIDSIFVAEWTESPKGDETLFYVGKTKMKSSELASILSRMMVADPVAAAAIFDVQLENLYNSKLVAAEESRLITSDPSLSNLMKEYNDGSLLFEISKQKVWDKAAQDIEAQKRYFDAHRAQYKWRAPKAKGYLVQTVNDSVASLIKHASVGVGRDSLVTTLRKQFGSQISVDKVLADKGQNLMVDYLLFNGKETKGARTNFPVFFMIDPRVIDEPEEFGDVRAIVAGDYQNMLQDEWEAELRNKYAVKVNEGVLRRFKK